MLVEPLVVSSYEFSFFFTLFQKYSKNHKYILFYVSHFFVFHRTSLFHSLFSFPFILSNIVNIHVNIPCNLLSPLVLVDSTHFSLYAIRKYRESQRTHTLNIDFKTYTFRARFFPINANSYDSLDVYISSLESNKFFYSQ